ncbi:MAG: hypothetical protein AAF715_28065 [Myxococcota bacterium]
MTKHGSDAAYGMARFTTPSDPRDGVALTFFDTFGGELATSPFVTADGMVTATVVGGEHPYAITTRNATAGAPIPMSSLEDVL